MANMTYAELQSKYDTLLIQYKELEERFKTLETLYIKIENKQHNERGAGRKKKLTSELIGQIHKLKHEQYMTIQQIAEELNISVGLVHKALHT
jgi:DNA-binding transcriptional regulator YiaG